MTRLEYLRRTAGMSQIDLALKIGSHPSLISKLERGWQSRLSKKAEKSLFSVFGLGLQKLLEPTQRPAVSPSTSNQE